MNKPPSSPPTASSDVETAHILVIDDDQRIRDLLKRYLEEQGLRVTTAKDVTETEQRMVGLEFDLIVLDIMMPGEDGLSFAVRLKQKSSVPTLMLTARSEAQHRIDGLERGVDDYLGKPFEPRELFLRIQTILRRTREPNTIQMDGAPHAIRFGPFTFNVKQGTLMESGRKVYLTAGESQLLQQLAQTPDSILSRKALCAAGIGPSERSIDVQIARLRRKIEETPHKPTYLQTVRNAGYILKPDSIDMRGNKISTP
ncbi:MAG: response regulator [Parvularculales bacterium]